MRKLAIAAAIVALATLLAWVGGCVSAPLPPAVDEDGASSRLELELELGVEADRVAPFSDELVRSLAASGIFARVDRLDRFASPPDLVATVEHGWRGNAAIPIFTAFSLGLIPTVVEETYGLAFTLHAPHAAAPALAIDTRWSGRIWLGLAASLLNLSPDRSGEDWRTHPHWIAHLRHTRSSRAARKRDARERSRALGEPGRRRAAFRPHRDGAGQRRARVDTIYD